MSAKGRGKSQARTKVTKAKKAKAVSENPLERILSPSSLKKLGYRAGIKRRSAEGLLNALRPIIDDFIYADAYSLVAVASVVGKKTISRPYVEAALKARGMHVAVSPLKLQKEKKKTATLKARAHGTAAGPAIRHYQSGSGLIIRNKPFRQVLKQRVDEIAASIGLVFNGKDGNATSLRFSKGVQDILQFHLENYLVKILRLANLIATAAKRTGIKDIDIQRSLETEALNLNALSIRLKTIVN